MLIETEFYANISLPISRHLKLKKIWKWNSLENLTGVETLIRVHESPQSYRLYRYWDDQ